MMSEPTPREELRDKVIQFQKDTIKLYEDGSKKNYHLIEIAFDFADNINAEVLAVLNELEEKAFENAKDDISDGWLTIHDITQLKQRYGGQEQIK